MTFWKKHFYDFIFLAAFIIIFALEISNIIGISFNCEEDNCFFENLSDRYYINYILITIIPLIDTIITVCITFPSTTIYGIKYTDFRKMRGKYEYSLTSMIVISLLLLVFAILSYYLSLFITTILLNVFAFIYALIFCAKEIPILVESKKRIYKIVKKCFVDLRFTNDNVHSIDYANKDALLSNVITYMLFTYGLYQTHDALSKKHVSTNDDEDYNVALLYFLLKEQNKYLNDLRNDYPLLKNVSGLGTYKNVDIVSALNKSIQNISDLLSDSNDNPLMLTFCKYINIRDDFYKSIFAIYYVLEKFDLLDDYYVRIKKMISLSLPKENMKKITIDFNNALEKVSNSMLVYTLKNGNTWYVDYVVKIKEDKDLFACNNVSYNYILYASMCLYYANQFHLAAHKSYKNIVSLLDGQMSNLINEMYNPMDRVLIKSKIEVLDNFMDFWSGSSNVWSCFAPNKTFNGGQYKLDQCYILHWWIGYLFMDFLNPTENELILVVDTLNKYKNNLDEVERMFFFDFEWFSNKSHYKKAIYDYFNSVFGVDLYYRVKSNIEIIRKIQLQLTSKKNNIKFKNKSISSERKIFNYISEQIKKVPYYSNEESLDGNHLCAVTSYGYYASSSAIESAFGAKNFNKLSNNFYTIFIKDVQNRDYSGHRDSKNNDNLKIFFELSLPFDCQEITPIEYLDILAKDGKSSSALSSVGLSHKFFHISFNIAYRTI